MERTPAIVACRRPRCRSAGAKRISRADATTRLGLFLDILNLNNSDQAEGIASTLGTAASFGAPTAMCRPAARAAKLRW
jgi:hypothetical protein